MAPHPAEFRRRAVELARERAKPIAEVAKDLRISALLLYMWVGGVWYGSFRLTGPQASMTVASAASALWKP